MRSGLSEGLGTWDLGLGAWDLGLGTLVLVFGFWQGRLRPFFGRRPFRPGIYAG